MTDKDYNKEHMAKASGKLLAISTKASIEICNSIRKKTVAKAKNLLKEVITLRKPVKYTRFMNGAGHKKGMASGKYPVKASSEILKVIETAEANAQFKGLNTSNLIINHLSAHKAGNVWHYGRVRRRKMKRTHIEIIVEEGKSEKKTADKKPVKDEKNTQEKKKNVSDDSKKPENKENKTGKVIKEKTDAPAKEPEEKK